jgi:esterase/lipase
MSNSSKSDRLKKKIELDMEERRKKQLAEKSKLEISNIKKQAKYFKKREKFCSLHQYLNPKLNSSPHPLILIGAKQIENIKENCIILTEMSRSTSAELIVVKEDKHVIQ